MARPPKPLDTALIAGLHASGKTITSLAKQFNVHNERIEAAIIAEGGTVRYGAYREAHPRWKGGRFVDSFGYVRIVLDRDDPLKEYAPKGHMFEHRYVMSQHLGRPVRPTETVHHIDGNRQNNDISNLQLRQSAHGEGSMWKCQDCGSHNIIPVPLPGDDHGDR